MDAHICLIYNILKILQFYNNIGFSFPNALVKSLIFFRICGLQKSCSLSSPLSLPNHSLTNTIFSEIWAPHGSCQNSTHISNYSNPLITNDLQWPQFNFANSILLRVWAIQGPRRKFTNNLKIIQFYIYKQFRLQWSHSSHTYTTTSQSTWVRLLNLIPILISNKQIKRKKLRSRMQFFKLFKTLVYPTRYIDFIKKWSH